MTLPGQLGLQLEEGRARPQIRVCLGDGEQLRNFIHVADVVSFLRLAVERPARGFFNLRSDIQLRIGALAGILLHLADQAKEIVYRPDYLRYEPRPIELFSLDAPFALGWRPRVTDLAAGLADERHDVALASNA